MHEIVKKEEVEELLGSNISSNQFEEALMYAVRKQDYSYQQSRNPAILQHWYLVKLVEEYVRNLAFSRFTEDLCRNLYKFESISNWKSGNCGKRI